MTDLQEFLLIAKNEAGEERASIRFSKLEEWPISDLWDLINGWLHADPERRVSIRPAEAQPIPDKRGE